MNWVWVAIAGTVLLLYAVILYKFQQPYWRIKWLSFRFRHRVQLQLPPRQADAALVGSILSIIRKSLDRNKQKETYMGIELLKQTYGHGLVSLNEPERLKSAITFAINKQQPDAAGHLLDAYRLMLRKLPPSSLPGGMYYLTLIGITCLKAKYSFLAARASEIMLTFLECGQGDDAAVQETIKSLRSIGFMAMKRNEQALAEEIAARTSKWCHSENCCQHSSQVLALITHLLQRAVKTEDRIMYSVLIGHVLAMVKARLVTDSDSEDLLTELSNMAGAAALNPFSQLAPALFSDMLEIALYEENSDRCRTVIIDVAQAVTLAINRYGLEQAFPLLLPLLNTGRRLLQLELKFNFENSFRQQALCVLFKECLTIVQFAARKNMICTAGEIIVQLFSYWRKVLSTERQLKATKKFCQFLLLYWTKTRSRQAKRGLPDCPELTEPMLISDNDRVRLPFL